jgi:hypothetical protein
MYKINEQVNHNLKVHKEYGHKHSYNLDFGFPTVVYHFPGVLSQVSFALGRGGLHTHTTQPQNCGILVISNTKGNDRKRYRSEDGCLIPVYMALQPRRQSSSQSLPWEPQVISDTQVTMFWTCSLSLRPCMHSKNALTTAFRLKQEATKPGWQKWKKKSEAFQK